MTPDKDGNAFPPFMPVDPKILNILQPGKRVMVSYPRTGSNWLEKALNSLIAAELGENLQTFPGLPDLYTILSRNCNLQLINGSRIIKTHSWDGLPPSKIVYVTRSLEDTMISYWTYAKRSGLIDDSSPMETFVQGNVPDAVNHHNRLLHEVSTGKHNIIVTSYERMQRDFAKELRRVSACLDISTTNTAIQAAVDLSQWSIVAGNIQPKNASVIWRGRSGSGAEIFSADLLDWIRKQETTYLPAVEMLLGQTA